MHHAWCVVAVCLLTPACGEQLQLHINPCTQSVARRGDAIVIITPVFVLLFAVLAAQPKRPAQPQLLRVPSGFTINVFSADVPNARAIASAEVNGSTIVYVGSTKAGNVSGLAVACMKHQLSQQDACVCAAVCACCHCNQHASYMYHCSFSSTLQHHIHVYSKSWVLYSASLAAVLVGKKAPSHPNTACNALTCAGLLSGGQQ